MKIRSIKYYIKEAFTSLKRNIPLTIAALFTVIATLFIFGTFMLAITNISKGMNTLQSQLEVAAFVDNLNQDQVNSLNDKISKIPGVAKVTYLDKKAAFEELKQTYKDNLQMIDGFDENNSPASAYFKISLNKAEDTVTVAKTVQTLENITKVRNDEETVKQVINIVNTIKWVSGVVFVVLAAISLFLIMNTIRITVFARRREISIMKFVGATNWFIRWPFVIEGMIIGIVGALLSNTILFYGYKAIVSFVSNIAPAFQLVTPTYVVTTLLAGFVGAGAVIGGVGSIIAVRKYLAV